MMPLGHGEKSVIILKQYINLTLQEEMIIRWHMGTFDKNFLSYSETIKKLYPECIIFFMADWSSSLFE